jgi:hypothetical protein
MKKKLNKLEVISVIVVLVIVLVFFYTIFKPKDYACTEEAKICSDGTVVVRVGENCDFQPCPDVEENRVYCTPEDRNSDMCTFLYDPVCAYPAKETFPNSCIACSDETVLYWVSGVCE